MDKKQCLLLVFFLTQVCMNNNIRPAPVDELQVFAAVAGA